MSALSPVRSPHGFETSSFLYVAPAMSTHVAVTQLFTCLHGSTKCSVDLPNPPKKRGKEKRTASAPCRWWLRPPPVLENHHDNRNHNLWVRAAPQQPIAGKPRRLFYGPQRSPDLVFLIRQRCGWGDFIRWVCGGREGVRVAPSTVGAPPCGSLYQ